MVSGKVSEVKYSLVKSGGRLLAVLLCAVMLAGSTSGCGGEADGTIAEGTTAEGTTGGSSDGAQGDSRQDREEIGQSWPADTPLGRYVEEMVKLPDGAELLGMHEKLHKLADGRLILTRGNGSMLVSKDNGKNWREDTRPWLNRMTEEEKYITSMAIGADNTVAVVYTEPMEEDEQDQTIVSTGQSDSDGEAEDSGEDETAGTETIPVLDTKLLVVKPDGTELSVETTLEEDDCWIEDVFISETGQIIVRTLGSNLYEVTEDGSFEKYLTVEEGRPELIQFHQNLMLMDGWGYKTPLIYDMEIGEYVEDQVLADFVEENYSGRDSFAGEFYDMFLLSGGDDIIYIAGDKGLYRHVLGGSAMEQVIDGSLSGFSNPSYRIEDMAALDNNEFLAVFTNGKLVRFVYDPNIPTVPVGKLRVYSLEEKPTVRQAISLYQLAHPAVYVEYEIGMGERDSVTREDALKKLNTQILAGEGPDVLILDNMPVDSYIEKGLLVDISPLVDEMSGENGIFINVKNAFAEDGHIYTVPCELQMPFILGRSKDTAQMEDLKGIADAAENLRKSNPGKNLLGIASARGIMRMFSMVSAPAWRTENGEIDSEAIADFLTQAKRIYDAQMDGLPESVSEVWQATSDRYVEKVGRPLEDTDDMRIMYDGEMNFMGDLQQFATGSLLDWYEYAKKISVTTTKGFEDCELIPMNGQCENVFWARTLLGISAASENTGMAEDFLQTVLGKENQMNLMGGMAVTKEGLLADMEDRKSRSQNNIFGSYTLSNDEGLYVHLVLRIPEEEEVQAMVKWIESADTAYVEDVTFEETVYEEGIAYLNEEKSLESAVEAIEKKLAIYLAE